MEKLYDVTKIYVATIAKQSKINTYIKSNTDYGNYVDEKVYEFAYQEGKKGLFVKTLGGYKHILTGRIYKEASRRTLGQVVLKYNEVYPLAEYSQELANQTDALTREQIGFIENKLNFNTKTQFQDNSLAV